MIALRNALIVFVVVGSLFDLWLVLHPARATYAPEPTCIAIALEPQHPGALIVTGRALRVCVPAPVETR